MTFVSPNIVSGGNVAGYAILLTYLTANKSNSLFSFVLGIPFERMIFMHLLCSLVAVALSVFHTYVAYTCENCDRDDDRRRDLSSHDDDGGSHAQFGLDPNLAKFLVDGGTNTSGTLILACLVALVVTSFIPLFRRYCFNIWLLTHILAAIGVIVFCAAHSVSSIFVVAVWWIVDCVVRYAILAGCKYPTKCTLTTVRPDIVQVSFPKPPSFTYRAGQFVQVAFPAISVLEFHPISFSSAPQEDTVTLHIRALGNWSRKLVELADKQSEATILLEGPYGNLSVDVDNEKRYKMALLVSGGIGVTPVQSVGKSLLYDHVFKGRSLKKLHFVWAVGELDMVHDIPPLGGSELVGAAGPVETRRGKGDIELATRSYSTSSSIEVSGGESSEFATIDIDNGGGKTITTPNRIVQTDVYLTSKTTKHNDDDSEVPPPNLSSYISLYKGRPDVDSIFTDTKQAALEAGETHVMVVGCGPRVLMEQLQEACRRHSGASAVIGCGGVVFDLHLETFEL